MVNAPRRRRGASAAEATASLRFENAVHGLGMNIADLTFVL
jgi:hypothetical protein